MDRAGSEDTFLISVIIVNYNGARWMERCLQTLSEQTVADQLEIIISDNKSTDGSDHFAAEWLNRTGQGKVIQNGANVGFCEGNNIGARVARGRYLLFLNSDTWLEKDCLQILCRETEQQNADASSPVVLDYVDDSFQSSGAEGLDLFGIPNAQGPVDTTTDAFAVPGCSLLVRRDMFERVGGFPRELFMYAEETDLGWRIWTAGGRIIVVPAARLHHRGAVSANPEGGAVITESRTNESKRFLSNRNGLLLLLKNAQHVLLLLVIPHLLLLLAEALLSVLVVRRWSYIRKSYIDAVLDCWRMRAHVSAWRARIRRFRQRGDFWMLRFLRLHPTRWNRWPELRRMLKFGLPKVDAR